jgi:hypothetical protein
MEIEKKKIVASKLFEVLDVPSIYEYGKITFGVQLADAFYFEIINSVKNLETHYLLHPECRHLETKSKLYRNIILGAYLIIYRKNLTELKYFELFTVVVLRKVLNL